jgi:hypothetical protein
MSTPARPDSIIAVLLRVAMRDLPIGRRYRWGFGLHRVRPPAAVRPVT